MPRTIGNTSGFLARAQERWYRAAAAAAPDAVPGRLTELTQFGSNPGALRMHVYAPAELGPNPALVVVLHGCTQSAAGYDHGAGWSTLADRFGFVLLFPEQTPVNNPKGCFNWFVPGDVARGEGEALSIREGVERVILDHGLARDRVFVTGLSAGGAMAGVMLATYPEVFAGGAIIAGLPYGCASDVQEAFEAMFKGGAESPHALGDRVRSASPHRGPWPTVSVWHGSADTTVVPANAESVVGQWLDVHDLLDVSPGVDRLDGYPRRVWRNAEGRAVVEAVTVVGMGHGTPLAVSSPDDPHGRAGPFLLDVGVASSLHIARFWGLTGWRSATSSASTAPSTARVEEARVEGGRRRVEAEPSLGTNILRGPPMIGGVDINGVITRALRSAGLMKP